MIVRKSLLPVMLALLLISGGIKATDQLMPGNPGFETAWSGLTDYGTPNVILKKVTSISSGVTGWTGDVGNGNLDIYQGPGHSGNNSVVLINTHATGGCRFYNNSVLKLTKGGKYKLTFYARGAATLCNVSLFQSGVRPTIAQVTGGNSGGIYDAGKPTNKFVSCDNIWTKMEYNYTVPLTSDYTDYKLYFAFYGCSSPAQNGSNLNSAFMIDDVSFEPAPVPSNQDTLLATAGEVSNEMMDSAIQFRSALRGNLNYRSGIYVYDSKSVNTYLANPSKLAARIALLGFNDVYLSASKAGLDGTDATKRTWIRNFNKAAHGYGLTVWALRLFSNTAFVTNTAITDECNRILNYNLLVSADEKFDAVSADWEPHVLKEGGADTPAGLTYFWDSSTNYGIGGSNDKLLQRTLDMLSIAKSNINSLPLNEAIHYMYQNNYNQGLLSYGSTLQYLNNCNFVTEMCYADTKEEIWQRGLSPIDNAQSITKSVSIAIKTSLNTYGDGGDTTTSLYTKGWKYLIESLNYFYDRGAQKAAFRGIDFFEFEGLEMMWNNTNAAHQKEQITTQNDRVTTSKIQISYNRNTESLIFPNSIKNYQIELYSVNGHLIIKDKINNSKELSISHLSKGYYLVKLICETELPVTYKFLK